MSMTEQQIQLGLHLALLADDRYTLLFRKPGHPHSILGAGMVMSLLHGKEFATNAEVVAALAEVYETLPHAIGVMDYLTLKQDQFVSATLQTLDLLHALKFVPATGNYLIMQDFYNYY